MITREDNPVGVHLDDLAYFVVAVPGEYVVSYEVYSLGSDCELFLHGEVKWDGCSNWHFDEQDIAMIHFCGRQSMLDVGKVLAFCYDWTSQLCDRWYG